MRRYRRNQEQFSLRVAEREARASSLGIRGLYPCGLVVNPRNKEPVLVVTDGENVGIRSLKASTLFFRHGTGYYDTTGHGKSKEAENLTGYPRSHTPSGSTPRGAGYGTSLYTALALGAYLQNNGHAEIQMDVEGDGISSESEGRSREADAWWDAAHARGLTDRETQEGEAEVEEYVDLDMSPSDLESCASLDEGQTITYVNKVSVDLEKPGEELTVDFYRYYSRGEASAYGADLVPVEFKMNDTNEDKIPEDIPRGSELRWLYELAYNDTDFWGDANKTALLALDVRELDKDAMKLISLAYLKADLGDKELDALWYRWQNNLDPSSEFRQLGLFSPNARAAGLSGVVEARKQAGWANLASLP